MLVVVIPMGMMKVSIVEIVDVVAMFDGCMAAIGAMNMWVVVVCVMVI